MFNMPSHYLNDREAIWLHTLRRGEKESMNDEIPTIEENMEKQGLCAEPNVNFEGLKCGHPLPCPRHEGTPVIVGVIGQPTTGEAFICPMCKGRKQIDKDEWGLWSPSDKFRFGECTLCEGDGFVVKRDK